MNTDRMVKVFFALAVVGGGIFLYNSSSDTSVSGPDPTDIYLGRVLEITVDTIVKTDEEIKMMPEDARNGDKPFLLLSQKLASAYNSAIPSLAAEQIAVSPLVDASLLAYEDINQDDNFDEDEDALFQIEIDGQNSRVIATSAVGAVHDRAFSGSGMLTGFLLGNMLSRQSAQGATAGVSQKKKVSGTQARARARAGSGSHSIGK